MADEIALDPDAPAETAVAPLPLTPQDVLARLDDAWYVLPRQQMLAIRAQRETYIPLMIARLREIVALLLASEPYEGSFPSIALPMLTELKAYEALPAALDLISLPGDTVDKLFGDIVTEFFPLALAILGRDQHERIEPVTV